MEDQRIVAFLPLRSKSKRILDKNLSLIAKRPMWWYVANAANRCFSIDHTFITADALIYVQRINSAVKTSTILDEHRISVYQCDYMDDDCIQEIPMADFMDYVTCTHVVLLQATSPFLEHWHLHEAIEKYFEDGYDSMFSGYKTHEHVWENQTDHYRRKTLLPRRKYCYSIGSQYVTENGAFYITSRKAWDKTKKRLSGKVGCYIMNRGDSLQVDNERDLKIADYIMRQRLRKE